jgi:membrane fusion protein (multidrug efflux system)
MSKTVKRILTFTIALIVIFLIALPKLDFLKAEKNADVATASMRPANPVIPVTAVVVEPKKLDNKIQVTGAVQANESLEIRSEISGKVTSINFEEGQRVRKGELLLTINDEELIAQLEKLKYSKQLREESEYRQRMLLEKEAISQEEYDQALTELNTARADIRLIEAQIAKSRLRAPFNGIIGLRYVSEGSYITPQTTIATFSNIDPAKIEFSIPGKYSNDVQVGNLIEFQTESSDDMYQGEIYAIEPQIDPETRTLRMRAISPNKDRRLLPGQFARVDLILDREDNAILVPSQAVIPEMNGHKVFVVNNGKAEARSVEVGIRTNLEVEIRNGISPQDTVVTSGLLQIKPGSDLDVSVTTPST